MPRLLFLMTTVLLSLNLIPDVTETTRLLFLVINASLFMYLLLIVMNKYTYPSSYMSLNLHKSNSKDSCLVGYPNISSSKHSNISHSM